MTLPSLLKATLSRHAMGDTTAISVSIEMRAVGFHGGPTDPRSIESAIEAPIHQIAYSLREWLKEYETWTNRGETP